MFGSAFSRVCAVSCYISMNKRHGSRTEHTPRVYRCLSTWWTHTRSIPRSLRARTLLNVFCTLAQRTKTNASALSRTITPLCPFDRRLRSIKRCHWIERSHSFESSEPHFLRQRFDLTFRHAQLIAPGLQGLRVLTIAYSLFFLRTPGRWSQSPCGDAPAHGVGPVLSSGLVFRRRVVHY